MSSSFWSSVHTANPGKMPFFRVYSYIYSMNRYFYIHGTHILYSHAYAEGTNQTKISVTQGKKCRKCAISRFGRVKISGNGFPGMKSVVRCNSPSYISA